MASNPIFSTGFFPWPQSSIYALLVSLHIGEHIYKNVGKSRSGHRNCLVQLTCIRAETNTRRRRGREGKMAREAIEFLETSCGDDGWRSSSNHGHFLLQFYFSSATVSFLCCLIQTWAG